MASSSDLPGEVNTDLPSGMGQECNQLPPVAVALQQTSNVSNAQCSKYAFGLVNCKCDADCVEI